MAYLADSQIAQGSVATRIRDQRGVVDQVVEVASCQPGCLCCYRLRDDQLASQKCYRVARPWYSHLQSIKVRDICFQKGEILRHRRSKGFLRRSFIADESDDYVLSITGQCLDELKLLAAREMISAPLNVSRGDTHAKAPRGSRHDVGRHLN